MYLITLHSNDMHGLWVSDCNELTKGQLHMILSLPESKNKLTNAYCKYNPQDVYNPTIVHVLPLSLLESTEPYFPPPTQSLATGLAWLQILELEEHTTRYLSHACMLSPVWCMLVCWAKTSHGELRNPQRLGGSRRSSKCM